MVLGNLIIIFTLLLPKIQYSVFKLPNFPTCERHFLEIISKTCSIVLALLAFQATNITALSGEHYSEKACAKLRNVGHTHRYFTLSIPRVTVHSNYRLPATMLKSVTYP